MIPVTQTRFYEPDAPPEKQRGNCLSAVVASLLEVSIDQVPNFVQDHVEHLGDSEAVDSEWHWWNRLQRFLTEHGQRMHYLRNVEHPNPVPASTATFPDPEAGELYAVSGISPRDPRIHHIVIYRDGEMVWDPHPDRTGLAGVDDEYHWSLRPVTDRIVRAAASIVEAEEQLVRAVADVRRTGASWATIGQALGVTRQAAWERFHHRIEVTEP